MSGAAGGVRWWSPEPLTDAVSRAPVLIRLEEGHRGTSDLLSFSAGDRMALQGTRLVRGRPQVLLHYTGEGEEDGDCDQYSALMTLPLDDLPDVNVSILEDPGGQYYANFVDTNFSERNWTTSDQDQILEDMEKDPDYVNVGVLPMMRRRPSRKTMWVLPGKAPPSEPVTPDHHSPTIPVRPPKPKPNPRSPHQPPSPTSPSEPFKPKPRPPPTLPKPSKSAPHSSTVASEPLDSQTRPPLIPPRRYDPEPHSPTLAREPLESQTRAPIIPPKLYQSEQHSSTVVVGPFNPDQPGSLPPPRPPRTTPDQGVRSTTLPKTVVGWDVAPTVPQRSVSESGAAPSFGGLGCLADFYCDGVSECETVPLPTKDRQDKVKQGGPVSFGPFDKIKNKFTKAFSQPKTTSPSLASASADPPRISTTKNDDNTGAEDSDEDSDTNYEMIDELTMDPKFDNQPLKAKKQQRKHQEKKGDTIEPRATRGEVRPTLRVPPHRANEAPLQETHHHPMMAPAAGKAPVAPPPDAPLPVTSPLAGMSCTELCDRLTRCHMKALADVCRQQSLDGEFFLALSDTALLKPPFNLDEFEVSSKMTMIKVGWVPRL